MAKDNVNPPFANGYWIWDDNINGLTFISRDVKELAPGLPALGAQPPKKDVLGMIRFKDTVDNLGLAQFRRQFQRRIKPNEPNVVTIQDIKDVALFTADRNDLTAEFIKFLHTKRMDEFLRTLIVYFQFYFQVWENLILRREEAKRKLWQPIVTVLEDVVRDNLADLRSMVARNYAYIILGLKDTFKYYHMSRNNVSLSDKDRHLYECLLSITPRIVWIAMMRKNFTVIEIELNRVLRTEVFNIMSRIRQSTFQTNAVEDRVLLGKACTSEKKLKHRSPAIQELIFDNHCYIMLAIGWLRVLPQQQRSSVTDSGENPKTSEVPQNDSTSFVAGNEAIDTYELPQKDSTSIPVGSRKSAEVLQRAASTARSVSVAADDDKKTSQKPTLSVAGEERKVSEVPQKGSASVAAKSEDRKSTQVPVKTTGSVAQERKPSEMPQKDPWGEDRKTFDLSQKSSVPSAGKERRSKFSQKASVSMFAEDEGLKYSEVCQITDRVAYLEAAYTAPEELLFEIGIGVGILGLSKQYLNPILMPKEGMGKRIHIPPFKLPEMVTDGYTVVGKTLPANPPLYTETEQSKIARVTQCKIWRKYVTGQPAGPDDVLSGASRLLSLSEESESTSVTAEHKKASGAIDQASGSITGERRKITQKVSVSISAEAPGKASEVLQKTSVAAVGAGRKTSEIRQKTSGFAPQN